jgi:histidyl-tRNA synthetase
MSKDTPKPNTTNSELDGFLKTLKVHNRDLDACFNDAVAVAHLEALIASKVEEARIQTALDVITQFKQDRINHTLSVKADEWERELETADKTLARYLQALQSREQDKV